jgi:hypothetical protein
MPIFEPWFDHLISCLPTRGTKVRAGPEWLHEIKYDGYRLQLWSVEEHQKELTLRRGVFMRKTGSPLCEMQPLSSSCCRSTHRFRLRRVTRAHPQEQAACRRDASRFCRQQLADDFAVQQCLLQNRARLSRSCQKVFQSHGM